MTIYKFTIRYDQPLHNLDHTVERGLKEAVDLFKFSFLREVTIEVVPFVEGDDPSPDGPNGKRIRDAIIKRLGFDYEDTEIVSWEAVGYDSN